MVLSPVNPTQTWQWLLNDQHVVRLVNAAANVSSAIKKKNLSEYSACTVCTNCYPVESLAVSEQVHISAIISCVRCSRSTVLWVWQSFDQSGNCKQNGNHGNQLLAQVQNFIPTKQDCANHEPQDMKGKVMGAVGHVNAAKTPHLSELTTL